MEGSTDITVVVKTPDGAVADLHVKCASDWDILRLKGAIQDVHPASPAPEMQKLVHAGRLLADDLALASAFQQVGCQYLQKALFCWSLLLVRERIMHNAKQCAMLLYALINDWAYRFRKHRPSTSLCLKHPLRLSLHVVRLHCCRRPRRQCMQCPQVREISQYHPGGMFFAPRVEEYDSLRQNIIPVAEHQVLLTTNKFLNPESTSPPPRPLPWQRLPSFRQQLTERCTFQSTRWRQPARMTWQSLAKQMRAPRQTI